MKIIFNLTDVGLGNNGGSRTIIKCAENLHKLGHKVILFSNLKSRYSWHKIDSGVKIMQGTEMPKAKIIVATGYRSVRSTLESDIDNKYYYIRGLETWATSEKNLIRSFKSLRCIVNSEWLSRYLAKRKIRSHLVYPGLDLDIFGNDNADRLDNTIGGLFSSKHKTKNHKFIIKASEKLSCDCLLLNRDLVNATPKESRNFYNKIKVWLAPTELEGLHNPPIEASLCGCAIVATDHPKSGMSDYLIHNQTAMIYRAGNLEEASEYVTILLKDDQKREDMNKEMVNLLKKKIGTRQDNMKKMLSIFKSVK